MSGYKKLGSCTVAHKGMFAYLPRADLVDHITTLAHAHDAAHVSAFPPFSFYAYVRVQSLKVSPV